ncbi:MAG: GNAT family N-acetyltransferase [Thermodesulfobacteriota bacterium]
MLTKKVMSLRNTVTSSNVLRRAFRWKLRQFKPKVPLLIESSRFVIKTVENSFELEKALNLRYEVFYRETLNKDNFSRTDIDKFDSICDHLIIIDKKQNTVVGTYRFISSTFSDKFYSESEFAIDQVKNAEGVKLELGRACVHRDYRNGTGIALLWKGLSEYFKTIKAKYLFGCSSIGTTNIVEISLIYKYIKELYLSPENFRVFPNEKHRIKELDYYLSAFDKFGIKTESIEDFIPPLLKSYLKAGSVICGEPAIDNKFKCSDFFTVLDLETLSKSFEKRYKAPND